LPTALPSHVKYWAGIEVLVKEAMAPPVAAKAYPTRKKKPNRGMGLGPVETESEDDES
jgi:hypothetical protein